VAAAAAQLARPRLITLSVLGTLVQAEELALHLGGALDAGDLTPEEAVEFVLPHGHYAGGRADARQVGPSRRRLTGGRVRANVERGGGGL